MLAMAEALHLLLKSQNQKDFWVLKVKLSWTQVRRNFLEEKTKRFEKDLLLH